MAVLIGDEIKKAIRDGIIKIEPFDDSQIGPGSVDLTLGNDFRIFRTNLKTYRIENDSNFEDVSKLVGVADGETIAINPGEMILGITREKITLANNIAARLEGRSRFARFGLAVHVTAGFMQPGISNKEVLEIVNLGHTPLSLSPGTKICQLVFEECKGEAQYSGRFVGQERP
ncbi:MAG: dCTP deaminase [Candidatus Pacebacteria bacterium]|jgi:dCTP deaminase|nr:dCTP deaminase [Candidatus Paceibacterota bacterium]